MQSTITPADIFGNSDFRVTTTEKDSIDEKKKEIGRKLLSRCQRTVRWK